MKILHLKDTNGLTIIILLENYPIISSISSLSQHSEILFLNPLITLIRIALPHHSLYLFISKVRDSFS